MIITQHQLRNIIREEIARNLHSVNDKPFSFTDFEDIDISIYPTELGDAYYVEIETTDKQISLPIRSFPTEPEAQHYARNKSEELRRRLTALDR